MGEGDGGLHDVGGGAVIERHPSQLVERTADGRLVAVGPPGSDVVLELDSTVASTFMTLSMLSSLVRGEGAVSVKQFTPTTFCSPASMRRTRSDWLRTRRRFSSSMAAKAPPRASTSLSSAWASAINSAVFASITVEPAKMSP